MEYLANVAYVLYLLSYSVTKILWLRIITIVGAVLTMPYFYLQPGGALWTSLFWALMFVLINAIQIIRLVLGRYPVGLGRDERWIYERLFSRLDARAFTKLVGLGHWVEAEPEQRLIARGVIPEHLMVVVVGTPRVLQKQREFATMRPGQLLGELAFITCEPASADVVAREVTRCFAWPVEPLREHLEQHPAVADAMLHVLGIDVATKLRERNLCTRAV